MGGMDSSAPLDNNNSGLEVDWRQRNYSNGFQKRAYIEDDGLQYVPPRGAVQRRASGDGSRRILGLSIGMFWLVVAVIVVVLAGGIGGGVAGGLAAKKNSCVLPQPSLPTSASFSATIASATSMPSSSLSSSSSTSSSRTSSSSTTSAATIGPSPIISTPCTGNNAGNGSILTAHDATTFNSNIGGIPHTFQVLCNTNYPAGAAYGNPNLVDLLRIYTTDMEGCIDACVMYNLGYSVSTGGPSCVGVAVVKVPGEYCYLKSGTGVNNTSSSGGSPIDFAVLLG